MSTENYKSEQLVIAIFHNPEMAHQALLDLKDAGFDPASISYLRLHPDPSQTNNLIKTEEQNFAGSSSVGAISGGLLGGSLGWLVGLALLTVPGIGQVVGAGTLATLLGSTAAGAALGGLGGALMMYGIPENQVAHYTSQLQTGNQVLISVQGGGQERNQKAAQILEQAGSADIKTLNREVRSGQKS